MSSISASPDSASGTSISSRSRSACCKKQRQIEYERLRSLAHKESLKRDDCYRLSRKARRSGNSDLAKQLAEQCEQHERMTKRYSKQARDFIFHSHNPPHKISKFIDLHGLHVHEAERLLLRRMGEVKSEGKERLFVIAGKGKHSRSGTKIMPAIERMCQLRGLKYRVDTKNEWKIAISLEDYESEDAIYTSDGTDDSECDEEEEEEEEEEDNMFMLSAPAPPTKSPIHIILQLSQTPPPTRPLPPVPTPVSHHSRSRTRYSTRPSLPSSPPPYSTISPPPPSPPRATPPRFPQPPPQRASLRHKDASEPPRPLQSIPSRDPRRYANLPPLLIPPNYSPVVRQYSYDPEKAGYPSEERRKGFWERLFGRISVFFFAVMGFFVSIRMSAGKA